MNPAIVFENLGVNPLRVIEYSELLKGDVKKIEVKCTFCKDGVLCQDTAIAEFLPGNKIAKFRRICYDEQQPGLSVQYKYVNDIIYADGIVHSRPFRGEVHFSDAKINKLIYDVQNDVIRREVHYIYNKQGHLIAKEYQMPHTSSRSEYTYKNGRLIQFRCGEDIYEFSYDEHGNICQTGDYLYTYDEYNRVIRIVHQGVISTLEYDMHGNWISMSDSNGRKTIREFTYYKD